MEGRGKLGRGVGVESGGLERRGWDGRWEGRGTLGRGVRAVRGGGAGRKGGEGKGTLGRGVGGGS